jgi:hypothetical protein
VEKVHWLLTQPEPDRAAVVQLRGELDRLGADIATVEARAANTRAGYVYVISNIGSFGDRVVKIGMTRRLETMDRVRELGDASVPFRFDVHALVFSNDAVGLEGNAALAVERVNKVNQHREFFRTTPARVRELLAEAAGSHLLEFTESAEALEWRASGAEATLAPLPPEPVRADHPSEDDSGDQPRQSSGQRAGAAATACPDHSALRIRHLRFLLSVSDEDSDIYVDHIAFLLNEHVVVGGDHRR